MPTLVEIKRYLNTGEFDAQRAASFDISRAKGNLKASFVPQKNVVVNEENRAIEFSFASGDAVEHWFGYVVLDLSKDAANLERVTNGVCPFLVNHNRDDQVGVVLSCEADGNLIRGEVKFSRSARGEEMFQDVKDGIRNGTSIGFMVEDMVLTEQKEGEIPTYTVTKWTMLENSLASIPADIGVGARRQLETRDDSGDEMCPECDNPMAECTCEAENSRALNRAISNTTEKTMSDKNDNQPATPAVERTAEQIVAEREKTLIEWAGGIFGDEGTTIARNLIASKDGVTQSEIREAIAAERAKNNPVIPNKEIPGTTQRAIVRSRHSAVTAFKGEGKEERAYRFGQWLLGRVLFDADSPVCVAARKFCDENGLTRAMSEGVNESGGYTVVPEFSNDIIDLREQYGVFRKFAKVMPMASDTLIIPRRAAGLTPYFVAEAGSITASDKTWDQVQLVAKKLAVLARYSTEVSEDSIIDFANDLAEEIGYAFANKEDECGFNGTGSSTYGHITGVRQRLLDVYTTTGGVGLKLGTGNAYSELVLTDFEGVVGNLPQYAEPGAKWFVHRSFYWNVMVKLLLASGGVTASEVQDARNQIFMGYPVVFSQVLPSTEANGQVCALFGDLAKAAILGTRRDTTIATSEHSRFANDQIEIRGTERFDINVHSVGDATNAGPIVGLITANS